MSTEWWSIFSCRVALWLTKVLASATSPEQAPNAETFFSRQNATSTGFDTFRSQGARRCDCMGVSYSCVQYFIVRIYYNWFIYLLMEGWTFISISIFPTPNSFLVHVSERPDTLYLKLSHRVGTSVIYLVVQLLPAAPKPHSRRVWVLTVSHPRQHMEVYFSFS